MFSGAQSVRTLDFLRSSVFATVGVFALFNSYSIAEETPPFCDAERYIEAQQDMLVDPVSKTSRYQKRPEGYCEGFDPRPVTLSLEQPLRLVSLRTAGQLPRKDVETIEVRPAISNVGQLRVTIVSAFDFEAYRLDGEVQQDKPLLWRPKPVLVSATGLEMKHLGFVGTVFRDGREVLTPVQVGTSEATALRVFRFEATVKRLIQARDLEWRFGRYLNGSCIPTGAAWYSIEGTTYSSTAPVSFLIEPPYEALSCIEFSGTDQNGRVIAAPAQPVILPVNMASE